MIGTPEEEKLKRRKEDKDIIDNLHKCDADDLTGQKGYCGARLDKDDPSYKDGAKRTEKDQYQYYNGQNPENSGTKDWWNHLIKDKTGSMSDGMISNKILSVDLGDQLKEKYGKVVDSLSQDQRDKLEKEMLDEEAIKQGAKAKKAGMSKEDKEIANEMKELEKVTGGEVKKDEKKKSTSPISVKEEKEEKPKITPPKKNVK